MINCLNISALRRRNRGIVSTAVALGALIAPMPGFAQGPPMPPPPPDLEGPAVPNAGNGNAGAGVTLPTPANIPGGIPDGPKPTFTPQIQGGFTVSIPTLLQGTVTSVTGTVIELHVPTGIDTTTARRLQLEDASFASAQGKPVEKFKIAKGDNLIVILDPASEHAIHEGDQANVTPPPTRVLVVEKNVAATTVKTVAAK